MAEDETPRPFAMLGDPAAAACEGDACLISGSPSPDPAPHPDPSAVSTTQD